MFREEWVVILDYLGGGYANSFKKEPVAQAIGEQWFSLLELTPKEGVGLAPRERVYVGQDKRDKIQFIKGRLTYDQLTNTSKNELMAIVEEILMRDEAKYVNFFNKAGPITMRQHSLELLPSIGKKHMLNIINEREKKPFESFQDMRSRVTLMPNPVRVVAERIVEELEGKAKFNIFTRPAPRGEEYPQR
jgi:putative nucleotide binding protein